MNSVLKINNYLILVNGIQSKSHIIGTYNIFNISLPYFDDKIYALDDGVNTLAYFHKDIKD